MHYLNQYNKLIVKARRRTSQVGYTENHHILPRSLGGTNAPGNLIRLTAKEHYIAHALLYKGYNQIGDNVAYRKMLLAFNSMNIASAHTSDRYFNATLYSSLRQSLAESMKGEGNPMFGKVSSRKGLPMELAHVESLRNAKKLSRKYTSKFNWIHTVTKETITCDIYELAETYSLCSKKLTDVINPASP